MAYFFYFFFFGGVQMFKPMEETKCSFIDTLEDLVALNETLCKVSEFAVDLEVRVPRRLAVGRVAFRPQFSRCGGASGLKDLALTRRDELIYSSNTKAFQRELDRVYSSCSKDTP